MLYSASFDRLRPKSTRKRRRSNGGAEDDKGTDAPAKSSRTALSMPSASSSLGSGGSSTKGFKKEYCRLKTLVPALSDREDLSKASVILFCYIENILELNKSFQALLGNSNFYLCSG